MSLNCLFCSNNSPKPKYIHPTVIFIIKEVKVWWLFAKYVDLFSFMLLQILYVWILDGQMDKLSLFEVINNIRVS